MEELKVHPVAALFPMMTEDELNDLAADIQANGLVHPIVLDAGGVLIDGRNRLDACHRGCVEPEYTTFEGDDPVAFILSCNVARRHLNKGQAAMAVAKSQSLLGKDWDGRKVRAAQSVSVSAGRISQAVVVLEFAPEFADAVLAGFKPLNEAYEEARYRKAEVENQSKQRLKQRTEEEQQYERLRSEAPDLADLVSEDRLKLAEALSALDERKRKEREMVQLVSSAFDDVLTQLDPMAMDPEEFVLHKVRHADPHYSGRAVDFSPERARKAAATLLRYAEVKEKMARG